jgi:pilus assembly protein CpaB
MRSRGLMMLLLAGVAGLLAVLLAARWMQQQGGDKEQIAVANTDIELGARISPEQVRMVDWPAGSIPQGAFTDAKLVPGRVMITSLQRGEPILQSRLAPEGTKGGLSAVVANGKREMTVRVNDVVGVAGFALPGTFVDIMVHTQEEKNAKGSERAISKIVLESILVLAVAQEADRDNTKPKVVNAVTLEVLPQQAELLDLARSVGTLSLVLRNQGDPKPIATAGVTKTELLGQPPAPAASAAVVPVRTVAVRTRAQPAPAPVRSDCVELIRGLNKVIECF